MRSLYESLIDYFRKVNWMLLLFLVLVLNVKMPVKVAAVVLFLLLNRKLFRERSIYRQKYIWFYASMIAIAVINFLLQITSVTIPYAVVVSVGIIFWLLCIAAAFLNSWFVEKTDTAKLHNTITLFFILNAAVTIGQLLLIILDAGSINPYTYQGMYQKYFISTGDLMRGITWDVSTTNAIINSLGVIYFLDRNKASLVLLCMSVLLLTGSNFTYILLLLVLALLFIFQSSKNQKSLIIVCALLTVIFMVRISPQNNRYITSVYQSVFNIEPERPPKKKTDTLLINKPDSILNNEERKEKTALLYLDSLQTIFLQKLMSENPKGYSEMLKGKPGIPKANIHTPPFQRKKDTTEFQNELLRFADSILAEKTDTSGKQETRKLPGKIKAVKESLYYLRDHPVRIITGVGAGNFSSKLAFRATGLRMAGGFPKKYVYVNDDFKNNHFKLYLDYFSKDAEYHSLINTPNSVYDQLLIEYGIIGLFSFIFLYLGFFMKSIKKLTYGLPILLMMIGAFAIDYWFEQLSVVILFELLMLLNNKETKSSGG